MPLGTEFPAVLLAAQAGAEWAVDVLFREFHPPLLRYLRARAGGEGDDLAADVWLALTPQLARFTGDEDGFRALLFTIAHRRLMGHQRKSARRRTDPVDHERLVSHPAADDPAEQGVAAVAAQQAVDRLVACLPPDQAEVVLLRVVAGLPAAEVGRITGRSAGAVRVLQHRALRRLARELSDLAVTP